MEPKQLYPPYRYKHRPTDLYFCPKKKHVLTVIAKDGKKFVFHVKTNLSKVGKIYFHSPPEKEDQGPCKAAFFNHCHTLHKLINAARLDQLQLYKEAPLKGNESQPFNYVASEWEVELVSDAIEQQPKKAQPVKGQILVQK